MNIWTKKDILKTSYGGENIIYGEIDGTFHMIRMNTGQGLAEERVVVFIHLCDSIRTVPN